MTYQGAKARPLDGETKRFFSISKIRLDPPVRLDDGKGAFATGKYHNYFAEILGKTEAETHAKVLKAFNQLFHGDLQKEALYIPAGKNAVRKRRLRI